MQKAKKPKRALKIALISILAFAVLVFISFLAYTSQYYMADENAWSVINSGMVQVTNTDKYIVLGNVDTAVAGYIFYPGAKVEPAAYGPYLAQLAQSGQYLCLVLKPAFNLAILSPNLADAARQNFPQIPTWAIGGHSLGGVAAANYVAKNPATPLVLLASYPNVDLSKNAGTAVLSITATKDTVLNWENYAAAKAKMPPKSQEFSINGGNHGQFGSYGHQKGDGQAEILPQEQWSLAAQATEEFFAAQLQS